MSTSSSGTGPPQGPDSLYRAIRRDRMEKGGLSEDFLATDSEAQASINDAVSKIYEKYCQLVGERLDAIPIRAQESNKLI